MNSYGITAFRRVMPSSPQSWYNGISDLLAEYTARDLRYESDIMLAVLGMFRALYPDGDGHLWGVPLSSFGECLRLD